MRVRARSPEIVAWVERDGKAAADLHGTTAPADWEKGGRIVSNVPLPEHVVAVENEESEEVFYPAETQPFAVQAVRWRARGWAAEIHRVVKFMEASRRTSAIVAASPWETGAWGGDSVLSVTFDPSLPPEAGG